MGLKRSDVSVHIVTTREGMPVEVFMTTGSIHDNTTFQAMDINLPANCDLYGDAAYINQQHKDLLLEFNQIRLKTTTKKNSLIKNTWAQELENRYYRKTIENTIPLQILLLNCLRKSMQ